MKIFALFEVIEECTSVHFSNSHHLQWSTVVAMLPKICFEQYDETFRFIIKQLALVKFSDKISLF